MGWRLPLLGFTRRDQVENPVDFQAERAKELLRKWERVYLEMGFGFGMELKREE